MRNEVSRKRSTKPLKSTRNLFRKIHVIKGLLVLNLKPFKSKIIGNHSIVREFQSGCARKETVDTHTLTKSRNGDRKIMLSVRVMSRPPSRIRKWNQLSYFR